MLQVQVSQRRVDFKLATEQAIESFDSVSATGRMVVVDTSIRDTRMDVQTIAGHHLADQPHRLRARSGKEGFRIRVVNDRLHSGFEEEKCERPVIEAPLTVADEFFESLHTRKKLDCSGSRFGESSLPEPINSKKLLPSLDANISKRKFRRRCRREAVCSPVRDCELRTGVTEVGGATYSPSGLAKVENSIKDTSEGLDECGVVGRGVQRRSKRTKPEGSAQGPEPQQSAFESSVQQSNAEDMAKDVAAQDNPEPQDSGSSICLEQNVKKPEAQWIDDDVNNNWDRLPQELSDRIFAHCADFREVFKARRVCKSFNDVTKRETFHHACSSARGDAEGSFSPAILHIQEDKLQWTGYDIEQKKWMRFPALACVPAPDPTLFKDYLLAGDGGLLVLNVSTSPDEEKLVVCNPLTQLTKVLPPLTFRRHPVLMHMIANKQNNTYKVIVAGSAKIGTEKLSSITEVYDSVSGNWTVTENLPGPEFAVNEYQTGAYDKKSDTLFCTAFLPNGGQGVLAYKVQVGKWLRIWSRPFSTLSSNAKISTAQLLEAGGSIYLFSEQQDVRTNQVRHCIDRLNHNNSAAGEEESITWTRVVQDIKEGSTSPGLLVYPEHVCIGQGDEQLCIFNTIEHTGAVYTIDQNKMVTKSDGALPSPPAIGREQQFHSLNPLGSAFEPSFHASVDGQSRISVDFV